MKGVLYLSYDGMTDPLGEAQVIPYLESLARKGRRIHLISFEKPSRSQRVPEVRERLAARGIAWTALRYTKRPPILSTLWDLLRLQRMAVRLLSTGRFGLVHCRSYLPAIVAARLKRQFGIPYLFDMRGLWPDEKVEAGVWPLSSPLYRRVYRFFKRRERALFADAAAVVSLSHAGIRTLDPLLDDVRLPVERRRVVPCSLDFELFPLATPRSRQVARATLGIPGDALVLTYLGSLGTWYMLDEMLDFFGAVQRVHPGSRFLFITPDAPDLVLSAAAERGLAPGSIILRAGSRVDVASWLPASDAGLFFIRPTPSKVSSSPTKLGEFLAMGIPVITNAGIGDVEANLRETGGGLVLDAFDDDSYRAAASRLDDLLALDAHRIREAAEGIFSLSRATEVYDGLYTEILADESRGPESDHSDFKSRQGNR